MTPTAAPLAAASRRLRDAPPPGFPGRPGRPRKHPVDGDSPVTAASQPRVPAGPERSVLASPASALIPAVPAGGEAWPRLLGAGDAARYLGVGEDTVLELLRTGTLHRVRIPAPVTTKRRGGEIRRVLLDRAELDALIGAWRER